MCASSMRENREVSWSPVAGWHGRVVGERRGGNPLMNDREKSEKAPG